MDLEEGLEVLGGGQEARVRGLGVPGGGWGVLGGGQEDQVRGQLVLREGQRVFGRGRGVFW